MGFKKFLHPEALKGAATAWKAPIPYPSLHFQSTPASAPLGSRCGPTTDGKFLVPHLGLAQPQQSRSEPVGGSSIPSTHLSLSSFQISKINEL